MERTSERDGNEVREEEKQSIHADLEMVKWILFSTILNLYIAFSALSLSLRCMRFFDDDDDDRVIIIVITIKR